MYNLVLHKASSPGWEFRAGTVEQIYDMLEYHVCESCKLTEKQYREQHTDTMDDEDAIENLKLGINPYTFTMFFPDNYNKLSFDDRISHLLDTACGCEFEYDNEGTTDASD